VTYAPSNDQLLFASNLNPDEKRALGLDPGQPTGYLGLNTEPRQHSPLYGYPSLPYRPALALDTNGTSLDPNGSSYQHHQSPPPGSSHSSAPQSGLIPDTASVHEAERIITPGIQYGFPGYPVNQPTYTANYPFDQNNQVTTPDLSQWPSQFPAPQFFPDFTPQSSAPAPLSSQHQGTISPSQLGHAPLGHDNLKTHKSFSDLMLESRGSTSSASSTDGGADMNPLEEWQNLHRVLPINPDRWASTNPQSTVGESTKRNEVHWAVPRPPSTMDKPSFHVPGRSPAVHNSEALDNALRRYITAPNRLAFGERKIIVMSPKVGQKSYGTEKRFLCPHPQAVLLGSAWWHQSPDGCPRQTRLPPRVNISFEGENPVKDATCSWTTIDGKNLDEKINTETLKREEIPFIGNVAGKNLHISDADSKRREARAMVTVKAPLALHAGAHGWGAEKGTMADINNEEIVGIFPSKEIKIISKPSKKKASSKSSECECSHCYYSWPMLIPVLVQHGTTVAIFNRVRSQTTSTRYLSITPDPTRILGSDGRPVTGAVPPVTTNHRTAFPGFSANANTWESFIIWLADPKLPSGPGSQPPLHPGWPSAPSNALFAPHLSLPIRYNNTVVLQSLQSGVCSPVLVIRRVEQDSDVVGGDGTATEVPACLPEGELGGDLVSQLQKVAFEVYRPEQQFMVPPDARWGGVWLSCDQEHIQDKVVHADRKWAPVPMSAPNRSRPNSVPSTPSSRYGILPMTPHTNISNLPGSPSLPSSPNSTNSSVDYFGAHSRKASSASLVSPAGGMSDIALPSTDGGPVRRARTGSSSAARGPLARPVHRKRQSGDVTTLSSYEYMQAANGAPGDGTRMFWTMSVGDVCIWTIVSTEQSSYTFYVPEYVKQTSEPYAPMPSVSRILPPDAAIDAGPAHLHTFTARTTKPLVTIYGKGFQKNAEQGPRHLIYYNNDPAEYNEARW
jgi:recombining binding protein (suppressor of hairless)